jgi:AMIN domain-containing protein
MLPSGIRSLVAMALLAGTAPASGTPALVQKVDVSADGEVTIRIQLSRPVPPRAGTVGRMGANPDRLFVDLPDTVLGPRARAAIPGRPPVLRVRTGQHEATARVVIDLEHATPFTVKTDGALVTVTLVSAP